MRVIPMVLGAAVLGIGATTALGAPTLSDPVLTPGSWSAGASALGAWNQTDFDPGFGTAATLEVNDASDGSALGNWTPVASTPGPFNSGVNALQFSTASLIGRHQVRVVIDGADGSPM